MRPVGELNVSADFAAFDADEERGRAGRDFRGPIEDDEILRHLAHIVSPAGDEEFEVGHAGIAIDGEIS